MQGRDFNGLTALFNSIAKLPSKRAPGTTSAIVEADPKLFCDRNIDTLTDIMFAASRKGLCNVQFNIIDAETHEVLCVSGDASEARRVGATYLGLPACTRVRVGEELTFINLPYAPETDSPEISTYELETYEPERENAYVFEFVDILMGSTLSDRVIGMELGDRYDMWLVLRGGIRIRVGGMEELERKLALADRALQDQAQNAGIPAGMPTLVDVSDPTRIIHRSSPDVELPDWALQLGA